MPIVSGRVTICREGGKSGVAFFDRLGIFYSFRVPPLCNRCGYPTGEPCTCVGECVCCRCKRDLALSSRGKKEEAT